MKKRSASASLLVGFLLVTVVAVGCQPEESGGESCGTATIEQTTPETANNQFSDLNATQCYFTIVDGLLQVDMLNPTFDGITPRVLFTFLIDGEDLPTDLNESLSREEQEVNLTTMLAPGVYQELDQATDTGPFWSSTAGVITFNEDESGVVTAEFSFDADAETESDNGAEGEVFVSGNITVFTPEPVEGGTCGMASGSMGMIMFMGLMGLHLRRRVRRLKG